MAMAIGILLPLGIIGKCVSVSRGRMSLANVILGRPLASSQRRKETLTLWTGIPVLGFDALASTGYGPEAILVILLPLGASGLHYFPVILLIIVAILAALTFSYHQTIAAYPRGGGAYIVAKENLGAHMGVWAAVALLLDYLLNVVIGISAGIGALISAIPALQPHIRMLCLLVLFTLAVVNLRGIRESGLIFFFPLILFVGCLTATVAIGLARVWLNGENLLPVTQLPPIPPATSTASTWLLLAAFASGCTAMTGVEAVSNAVPLFRKPAVTRAQRTLAAIIAILSIFLLGIAYLCPAYHIGAMHEQQPGYQTVLAQLIAAIAGQGVFYYVSLASIFIILTYSAQTSFTDFPRVCRLLAEDDFLPPAFAIRGRRLVFSHGIIVLSMISALLLIAFDGLTEKLIPLFAIGAFSAFVLSQAGMVSYWLRKGGDGIWFKVLCNGLGATTTGFALMIIIVTKFMEGGWITVVVAPMFVCLLHNIHRHYRGIHREMEQPLAVQTYTLQPPVVIIPIEGWSCLTEKAVRLGLMLSDDVTAVHISIESDDKERMKKLWVEKVEKPAKAAHSPVPQLAILDSPYRRIEKPILNFINKTEKDNPDRFIMVVIPELIEPHWYEYLLHNVHGAMLKTLLYLRSDDRTIVINCPWYLHDI